MSRLPFEQNEVHMCRSYSEERVHVISRMVFDSHRRIHVCTGSNMKHSDNSMHYAERHCTLIDADFQL